MSTAYGPSSPEEDADCLTPEQVDAIRDKRRALIEARVQQALKERQACIELLDWSPDPLGACADIITAPESERPLRTYRRLRDLASSAISEDDAADALRREGML